MILGIFSGLVFNNVLLALVIGLLLSTGHIIFLYLFSNKPIWNRCFLLVLTICLVFLVVGYSRSSNLPKNCPEGNICQWEDKKVNFLGKVVSSPEQRLEDTYLEIEVDKIDNIKGEYGKILVVLPDVRYEYFYGDSLSFRGKIKIPRTSNDNFSYRLYLSGKEIYSIAYYPRVLNEDLMSRKFSKTDWSRDVLIVREKIRSYLDYWFTEPNSSVFKAMLIGDEKGISEDYRKNLSKVGIIHILSISGAHVTLLLSLLLAITKSITNKKIFHFTIPSLGSIVYVIMAGSPGCAVRSVVMGVLIFLALFRRKISSLKILLWFSAGTILFFNPLAALADIGFQLSFLAIFGMACIYPIFFRLFIWGRNGFFIKIINIFLLSLSIELAVAPLISYYFGIISWISPIGNLILLPIFSFLLPIGFALVIIKIFSDCMFGISFIVLFCGKIIGLFADLSLNFSNLLISYFTDISWSSSQYDIKWTTIIVYYLSLTILIFIGQLIVKKHIIPGKLKYFSSSQYLDKKPRSLIISLSSISFVFQNAFIQGFKEIHTNFQKKTFNFNIQHLIIFWVVADFFLLTLAAEYLYASHVPPQLVMLNVGQGDSFLLNWPQYHFQILIDSGPGRRILPEIGKYMPFYDKTIEIFILSHPHQDHLEGATELANSYQFNSVFLSSLPSRNSTQIYKNFFQQIQKNNIKLNIVSQKDNLKIGTQSNLIGNFTFLAPLLNTYQNRINNLNNQSSIIKLTYPETVLFTGDSQRNLENLILEQESQNIQSNILKISHHGSCYSSSNKFLDAVNPKIALISVGKNNLFGQPCKRVIEELKKRRIEIYRTDKDGSVVLNLTQN